MNNTSKLLLGGIVSLVAMFGLVVGQILITAVHDHHVWHGHMHNGRLEMGMNSIWLVEFGLLVLIGLAIAWFV